MDKGISKDYQGIRAQMQKAIELLEEHGWERAVEEVNQNLNVISTFPKNSLSVQFWSGVKKYLGDD